MNYNSDIGVVSRRLFSLISALVLAAQIWGAAVFPCPGISPVFPLMHPVGLLLAAYVVTGVFIKRPEGRSLRRAKMDFLISAAAFTLIAFALPQLAQIEPPFKFAVACFYAASVVCLRHLHRSVFGPDEDTAGLWTMIPVIGPFAGLFVAGTSPRLSERSVYDRAVRQLPVAAVALVGVSLLTALFREYGWILFVMVPVGIGTLAAFTTYDAANKSPVATGIRAAMASLSWVYFLLAVMLLEGLVCLLMAAVIAYPLALLGALFGTALAKMNNPSERGKLRTIPLIFATPLIAEVTLPAPTPQTREVTTVVEVAAPPARIWQVMQNLEIGSETDDLLFRLGVAMPIATRTPIGGLGGERECVLSTGTMREIITDWQPGSRLEFRVLETPECMRELGLNGKIEAPHLTGKFICRRGVFELVALPGGRTRITGTSEVTLDVHPTAYWGLWSDEVVHRVHHRVFAAIAAEAKATPPLPTK